MDANLTDFGRTHFGAAQLGDARRTKRLVRVADRIAAHPAGSLPDKLHNPADLVALYRLMNCPATTHDAVTAPHRRLTRQAIRDYPGTVLIGHDDTDLDLSGKRSLRDDLGPLCGKHQAGYICHNSLAITPSGRPLGLANQILHVNKRRHKGTTRAALRDCPHRQSRLWVRGRAAIGDFPGKLVVDLVDRGGDTFEFLDFEHARGYHYVVRAQHDRPVVVGHPRQPGAAATVRLRGHLRALPERGRRPLDVSPKPARAGQPAQPGRATEIAVAWAAVTLLAPAPARARGEHRQGPLAVWVVRAWEPDPPAGCPPLEWFLVTNVAVAEVAGAWERVDWYEWRWPALEEYHKAQKTGCTIEGPQFTTVAALAPMIGVLSVVAWLLMYLRWAGRDAGAAGEPAARHVPVQWVRWLSRWRWGREEPDWTVREFVWALARLGGHQNRKGDGPPGWQTLWKGWAKLRTVFDLPPQEPSGECAQT
jgi:hypothetical protein